MPERTAATIPRETELEREKHFILSVSERSVGVGGKSARDSKQYPHFPLKLSVGEKVIMGDFYFSVLSCNPRSVNVSVSSDKDTFDLKQVTMKGSILKIRNIAEIVLRRIRLNGQPLFHVSLERSIPWYFPENASKYLDS